MSINNLFAGSIIDHVKTAQSSNNVLYNQLDEHKTKLKELENKHNELQEKVNNFSNNLNFITVDDLKLVIDDVKASLEFLMQATPRNATDIQEYKETLLSVQERLTKLEECNNTPNVEVDETKKRIPKLNIVKKK